jgi:hypothetical protein
LFVFVTLVPASQDFGRGESGFKRPYRKSADDIFNSKKIINILDHDENQRSIIDIDVDDFLFDNSVNNER